MHDDHDRSLLMHRLGVRTARVALLLILSLLSEPPASHKLRICAEEKTMGERRWS